MRNDNDWMLRWAREALKNDLTAPTPEEVLLSRLIGPLTQEQKAELVLLDQAQREQGQKEEKKKS